MHRIQRRLLLLLLLLRQASGFYIPGWSIRSYADGDAIPLQTNKVSSDATSLPYAYSELPFVCDAPGRSSRRVALNLGEVLRGDRIATSGYEIEMGKDVACAHLCDAAVDAAGIARATQLIRNGYSAEWIVDNLPGATSFVTVDRTKKYYAAGFKLGGFENDVAKFHNHVSLVFRWRRLEADSDRKVIVAFEVYPKSIKTKAGACPTSLDNQPPLELPETSTVGVDGFTIPYTYSIFWKEDDTIEWSSRWDLYFVNNEDAHQIHWLAIVNSTVIVMVLSGVVFLILVRTLSRDIQSYNTPDGDDDKDTDADITGWKLVHGDVFRPPPAGGLFPPLIGAGVQLLVMMLALLILSAAGILNPSYRGGFLSFALFLFVFAGVFSGLHSTKIYKTFGGSQWVKNGLMTALLVPGSVFLTVFILNLFVWAEASSSALPFGTLVALLAMWLLISLPLVLLGSFIGFRRPAVEHPTKANQIPRQIPEQPRHLRFFPSLLITGVVPFAVIFIELLFVFRSVWAEKSGYYYVYGFLGLITLILLITTVEITLIHVYFMLCAENYHWWWRSFFVGGASAIYVFGYCVWYYLFKLQLHGWVSGLLFLGYSLLGCALYGVFLGTVGSLSAYVFVRKIYAAVKVD